MKRELMRRDSFQKYIPAEKKELYAKSFDRK
jgi:hypothetical protein